MAEEVWKKSEILQSHYEVSNLGNIRHIKTKINRKIYYGKKTKKGEPPGIVTVKLDGKSYTFTIHRLIALQFLLNPFNLPEVNHIDGNRHNNVVTNLEWCTGGYNMYHAYRTNLRNYPRQLTDEQLIQLYKGLESGLDQHAMARALNIDASCISDIITKNTYKTINLDFSKFSKSYYTNKARNDIDTIRILYSELQSSEKIGELYNVSGRFIRNLLR